jgi:hypothetical protein
MVSLNLSGGLKKLPVSAFPDWADEYFCDNCGRDITKRLRRRESQSWQPIGAERFLCACGRNWLTGATERVLIVNIVFSCVAFITGLCAYFLSSEAKTAVYAGLIAFSLFFCFR